MTTVRWWTVQDENNNQRQGIIVVMVSCLLFCGIKFALCELGRHTGDVLSLAGVVYSA